MIVHIIKDGKHHDNYFLIVPERKYVGPSWLTHSETLLRQALAELEYSPEYFYDDHSAVKALKENDFKGRGYRLSRTLDLSDYPEYFI